MNIQIYNKVIFRVRAIGNAFINTIRVLKWSFLGSKIDFSARIGRLEISWPHQVYIGENVVIENDVFLKFDGVWCEGPSIRIQDGCFIGRGCEFNIKDSITIGPNSLIGSGSKFVDHDHGLSLDQPMKFQQCPTIRIRISEDVWIGANVVVLKGVEIGKGAVVAAGAVLNKSVPPFEIWGGIPARKIGQRVC